MKMERLNEEFAKLKAQEGVADEARALELPPQLLDALQVRACPNDAARPLLIVVPRLQVSGPTVTIPTMGGIRLLPSLFAGSVCTFGRDSRPCHQIR